MAKVKKLAKSLDATVNDVMLGIATTVLKKHFVKEKDETEAITMSVPFSFKCVPEKVADYVYKNTLTTPLSLYVNLTSTFEEGVNQSKKIMDGMKTSLIPMASFIYLLINRYFFSTEHNAEILRNGGKRYTILWSNIPGFLRTVRYAG